MAPAAAAAAAASSIRASAPGKLLLFGEHAVVYGCPTVAAALTDLRIHVTIERVPVDADAAPTVTLQYEDLASSSDGVKLRRAFAVAGLRGVVDGLSPDRFYLPKPSAEVMQRVEALLSSEHAEDARALRPAVFLCCAVLRRSFLLPGYGPWRGVEPGRVDANAVLASSSKPESLVISFARAHLPIGAGLGSSAAFCVALSGALAQLSASGQADSSETPDVSAVNAYAYAAEVILHGSPSGADNTVAAFGGALVFQRRPEPSFRAVRCDLNRFRFLLVNTRVPRSTKEQVGNVRARFEADAATVQGHFDAIEHIVRDFITLSESGALTRAVLAQQVEENHRLLNLLGVGHPQIDEVARISRSRGGATKLTGAGGGGCTVTLLPTEMTDAEVAALVDELEAHGFECFSSSLGGDGFRIDP